MEVFKVEKLYTEVLLFEESSEDINRLSCEGCSALIISPIENRSINLLVKEGKVVGRSGFKLEVETTFKLMGNDSEVINTNHTYTIVGVLYGDKSEHFVSEEIFSGKSKKGYDVVNDHNYSPLPSFLTIKESPIHGLGLFTNAELVGEFALGISHLENLYSEVAFEGDLVRLPLGGFINHSATPNCTIVRDGRVYYLETAQTINKGEELTVDYTKCPCG